MRPGAALTKYGRHAAGCGGPGRGCACGLDAALSPDAGPDVLAYLLLLRGLASAVRRCEAPIPEDLWDAAGKVARWEAAHRAFIGLLGGTAPASVC
jgi:hypothetical protein